MQVKQEIIKFIFQSCFINPHNNTNPCQHKLSLSWWRHQMEIFSTLLTLCEGNSPITGEFPHKGQWHRALMFPLICVWINGWVNNRETGDLRRNSAHYDVIVMVSNCAPVPYLVGLNVEYMVSKVRFDQHTRYIVRHWSHVNFIHPIASYIIKKCQCKSIANIEPIYLWNQNGIHLTHFPMDQMPAITQTIISNAFLWMKKYFYFD